MDSRFGSLFYKMNAEAQIETATKENPGIAHGAMRMGKTSCIKLQIKRLLVVTEFYELILRPHLSREMLAWVKAFQLDIIFAQGYNLAFTWLPMMLAESFHLPIAYYPTDDWTNDLYRTTQVKPHYMTKCVRGLVETSSRQLAQTSTVRIAFNPYMQETYLDFSLLMHGDDLNRFKTVEPQRLARHRTWCRMEKPDCFFAMVV